MSITSVRIKAELDESLKALAKQKQRSKSWIINEAVAQYLITEETSSQKWLDTLDALESIKQGRVVAGEEVLAWLESWGTDNELEMPDVKTLG